MRTNVKNEIPYSFTCMLSWLRLVLYRHSFWTVTRCVRKGPSHPLWRRPMELLTVRTLQCSRWFYWWVYQSVLTYHGNVAIWTFVFLQVMSRVIYFRCKAVNEWPSWSLVLNLCALPEFKEPDRINRTAKWAAFIRGLKVTATVFQEPTWSPVKAAHELVIQRHTRLNCISFKN